MMSLVAPLVTSAVAATPCLASSGSGGFQHGSSVNGNMVLICAVTSVVTPARPVVTGGSSGGTRPGSTTNTGGRPPTNQRPAWQNHWQPNANVVTAPVNRPATPPQHSVTPPTQVVNSGQAIFSPANLIAQVSPGASIDVGRMATFTSNAKTHFRQGVILSRAAEVRFLLQSVSWKIDSSAGVSKTFTWVGKEPGRYAATVRASYSVAYRFLSGGAWVLANNSVALSDSVSISVSQQSPGSVAVDPASELVLLVGQPCGRYSSSFGC